MAGIVNGGQVAKALDTCLNAFVNEATLLEEVAALHYTMANSIDLIETLDGTILFAKQGLEHEVHALFMVGHVVHEDLLLAIGQRQLQESIVQTDAFDTTLCQNGLVVHVVELILNG